MTYFNINYKHSQSFGKNYDYVPEDFIDDIFFDIYNEYNKKVGEGKFRILDFDKYMNYPYELGFYFEDILDSDRQIFNLFEVIATNKFIFNSTYNPNFYKSFFIKKFNNGLLYNKVGYLEELHIFNKYQGLNIGSMVLDELKDRFLVDFIAVIPYPLEYNKMKIEDINEKDFALKSKKVINFYNKNGFNQIAKSEFYMVKL
jgi:ribosomal protein S18 acetylase RimI-like enzyme